MPELLPGLWPFDTSLPAGTLLPLGATKTLPGGVVIKAPLVRRRPNGATDGAAVRQTTRRRLPGRLRIGSSADGGRVQLLRDPVKMSVL